jgi:hypothetical protein
MDRDDIDMKTKRRLFKLTAFSCVAFFEYSRLPLQGTEVAVKRIHHKKLAKGNSRRLLISEVSTMQVGASPLCLSLILHHHHKGTDQKIPQFRMLGSSSNTPPH